MDLLILGRGVEFQNLEDTLLVALEGLAQLGFIHGDIHVSPE